jgi:hypothetical protein
MAKAEIRFATLIYVKNLMGCQVEMATSSVAPPILNQARKTDKRSDCIHEHSEPSILQVPNGCPLPKALKSDLKNSPLITI